MESFLCQENTSSAAGSGPAIIPRQVGASAALPERIPQRTGADNPRRQGRSPNGVWTKWHRVRCGNSVLPLSPHRPHRMTEAWACPMATAGGPKWLPDAVPDCSHLSSRCAGTARPLAINLAPVAGRPFGDSLRPGFNAGVEPFGVNDEASLLPGAGLFRFKRHGLNNAGPVSLKDCQPAQQLSKVPKRTHSLLAGRPMAPGRTAVDGLDRGS
jgi:hypothetical protein